MKKVLSIFGSGILFLFVIVGIENMNFYNTKKTISEKQVLQDKKKEGGTNTGILNEKNVQYMNFKESIEKCNLIVRVVAVKSNINNGNKETTFEILEELKGTASENKVIVSEETASVSVEKEADNIEYISGKHEYIPGEEYILLLEKYVSVYQEQDLYFLTGDIYLPCYDIEKALVYNQPLSEQIKQKINNMDGMEDYLKDIVQELDKEKEVKIDDIGREYIHSMNLEEIIDQSPYIFKVKIEGVFLKGTSTVDTYQCRILKCLKGTPSYYQGTEDVVLITFLKDTVESGKVYYVLLDAEENSPLYALSSKNSVHMVGTEEAEYIKNRKVRSWEKWGRTG